MVICTLGQDTALTIRNTPAGGRRGGIATAAGVALGQGVWTVAASAGIAALLAASEPAFLALRLAGAAYLVFLGLQTLWAAVSRRSAPIVVAERSERARLALQQGFLSNLGNPKMAAFFTSLLPQFAASGEGAIVVLLLGLGFAFSLMTLCWLTSYAVVVAKASHLLLRPRIRRVLDAVTGAVLAAFGARVAASPR